MTLSNDDLAALIDALQNMLDVGDLEEDEADHLADLRERLTMELQSR